MMLSSIKKHIVPFVLLLSLSLSAQQETPFATYDVPSHNLQKFNRFLINPTFSTVREDKSYFNLQHRNQSISFEDNYRAYYLSYSGRIGDRAGLGLGVFNQREGLVDNYGVLANYAYGIRLNTEMNFTFGANFIYYTSGVNNNRANPVEADPTLFSLENSSLISFQPGFNLSYKNFDFGVFAENLFDYNLKTSESVTEFNEKTYTAHLQYTHKFDYARGLFEDARLLSLARVRKVGETDVVLGGSLILDLPNLGWLQAGYDDFYGAAAGLGFTVTKRVSLGYTVEKGFGNNFENFGINHEISLAYSFTPTLTENRVSRDKRRKIQDDYTEDYVKIEEYQQKELELAELREEVRKNNQMIQELLKTKDSLSKDKEADFLKQIDSLTALVNQQLQKEKQLNSGATKDDVAATKTAQKKKRNIIQNFEVPGVQSGYYIITNVFKSEKYVAPFINNLKKQGFNPGYFTNPRNNFKYVYIRRYDEKDNATDAYYSKLDQTYNQDMWIIKIKGSDFRSADLKYEEDGSDLDDLHNQHVYLNFLNNQKHTKHKIKIPFMFSASNQTKKTTKSTQAC